MDARNLTDAERDALHRIACDHREHLTTVVDRMRARGWATDSPLLISLEIAAKAMHAAVQCLGMEGRQPPLPLTRDVTRARPPEHEVFPRGEAPPGVYAQSGRKRGRRKAGEVTNQGGSPTDDQGPRPAAGE